MIFWITTTNHASRQDYFNSLMKQVNDLWYKTIVSVDDWTLWIYKNKKKLWLQTLETAIKEDDDCILAEDDIELCKEFQHYINQLDNEYLFYSLFNRLRWGKIEKKGEFEIYIKPKNWLYEQAIYIPKSNVKVFYQMYKAFLENLERLQKEDPRQKQHHDQMLQRFIIQNAIKRWNLKISIVEHVWRKSALWHFIGTATFYIDNIK